MTPNPDSVVANTPRASGGYPNALANLEYAISEAYTLLRVLADKIDELTETSERTPHETSMVLGYLHLASNVGSRLQNGFREMIAAGHTVPEKGGGS